MKMLTLMCLYRRHPYPSESLKISENADTDVRIIIGDIFILVSH